MRLIGLRQELGARRSPSSRRSPRRASAASTASARSRTARPTRPGVYLFHDRHGQVLYVGNARDLRARLRSYFRSERQRPSVEAALHALERIEWRVLGSELAAALEELRLIRELRAARELAQPQPRALRLPAAPRRRLRRHASSPAPLGPIGAGGRPRGPPARSPAAPRRSSTPARRRRRSPRLRRAARRPRRLPALRGGRAAARPDRVARARDRPPAPGSTRLRELGAAWSRRRRARLAQGLLRRRRARPGVRPLPPGTGALLELEAGLAACRPAS